MKLLIIDPGFSLASPSMKGVVRSLPQLRAAGFEIEVWCWESDEDITGVRIVRLPHVGRLPLIGGYAFSFWARLRSWWLFRVKGTSRPDVVYSIDWYLPTCDICHVHFSPWDWENRQRILGVHSLRDAVERVSGRIALWFANRTVRKMTARRVLAVSDAVAEDLRKAAPALASCIHVLPNSFDAARFHPGVRARWREEIREHLGFTDRHTVFTFVSAGHYRRKGFFLAVDSVALLRQRHPGARLLVVGGRQKTLRRLERRLDVLHHGWREWIAFTGMVKDVEKYFGASDAMLFPSYSEAFSLVEVEAAACGLPLFLTRHHGSEMILEEGVNGRCIEFDARRSAGVLAEFVSGEWKLQAITLKRALDGETYAGRLVEEIKSLGLGINRNPQLSDEEQCAIVQTIECDGTNTSVM